MTEKDAVKCQSFARDNFWMLPVTAALPAEFFVGLDKQLKTLTEEAR
ncbi:tetraacyldisaccharide 4'-kinase [Litorivivens sp.]